MIFSASPDKQVKIFTVAICCIFFLSVIGLMGVYLSEQMIVLPVLAVIIILAFILVYVYRPVSYTVTNDQLAINRIAGTVFISRAAIKKVDIINKKVVDGAVRTFGVGGLFGYFGKFSNSKIGAMTWYVSRMDKLVLITTESEKILVSPDDLEGFVTALR